MQPAWPAWLKTCRWWAVLTVLVLAFLCLLPTSHRRPPIEWFLLRGLSLHVKYYAQEHNGLWPTNWAQMTNTVFRDPRLYSQSIFLPDHYVFIPHDQNWEITPGRREAKRIVMLRSSPKTVRGRAKPGRYAIVFSPAEKSDRREFEVEWFQESEITNLLTQSGFILPPLQQHDSRTQWLSERKQQRLSMIGGVAFLAILLITPILVLIGAYHFIKDRPIG